MSEDKKEQPDIPAICLEPCFEVTEERLRKMKERRDQILTEMGYLPPDETHEFWHKPDA